MSEQKAPMAPVPRWVRLCRVLWKIIAYLGTAVVLGAVASLIGTWLTSPQGRLPADAPLSALLTHWPITLLVGCCLLLVAVVIWILSRWNTPALQMHLPTTQDRQRMLGRLRLRYEQIRTQSLQGVVQVELGLASRPAAVENAASLSWRLPDQPEQLLPPHTSIREAYDMAHQELLILGEPGAGKSTLLLELAQHLVQQAQQDVTQPLPALLPLSSWAVSRRPLQDWFTEQLTRLYDVPRSLSQQWIQAEQVLPLLDGLDEMEESARAACIAAINLYHRDHLQPLVVCSRTAEYAAATRHERLALHIAVVVQPLSREQVDASLANLGQPLAALRTALRKNAALQKLATTPLMVQVLTLAFHGTSVRELSRKEMQLREQIWTEYVERMVRHKGDARHYPLHVTTIRLGWLAAEMRQRNQTIFFLEQLQPDSLPKRRRILYSWSVGLLFGLIAGLVVGLLFGLVAGLVVGLVAGLVAGLLFGLFVGRGVWLNKIEPVGALTWKGSKSGLLRRLAFGLGIGLLVGLVGGLGVGLFGGLVGGLFGGPPEELSLKQQPTERRARSPNEGIRRSVKNGLLVGLYVVLLVGLYVGLLGWLAGGLGVGLFFGLVFGLPFGLLVGLIAAVQHYTLRFWLARSGVFPWQAVPFLEDATARVLLRRVGGGYSFAHRLLLDFFADAYEGASSTSSAARNILPSPP